MKFFDLVAGQVKIHPDALALPPFKALWEKYKDKTIPDKIITYIVLNNHPDSPYVKTKTREDREKVLKAKVLGNIEYDEQIRESEEEYISYSDTLTLKMLRGIRWNLELMSDSLNKKDRLEMTYKDMKELLDLSAKAQNAIKSIKKLEEDVKKEESDAATARGGVEIGHYEVKR